MATARDLKFCAAQVGFGPPTPVRDSLPLVVSRCFVVLYGLLPGGRETANGNETARSQGLGRAVSSKEEWSGYSATPHDSLPGAGPAIPGRFGYPQGSNERLQSLLLGHDSSRLPKPRGARPVTATLYGPGRASSIDLYPVFRDALWVGSMRASMSSMRST